MKRTVRITFAGGGTGGHVYPMLAVVEALKKYVGELDLDFRFERIGPSDGYEGLLSKYGVASFPIAAGKLRAYASIENLFDIPKFAIGLLQALWKLYFSMPDAVFSKGGTGALPVVIAAWFYRIPIVIHESDAVPGRTNRASARFANKIFVSFPSAAAYFDPKKTAVSGQPVRDELSGPSTSKELAKETLGFSQSAPLILILGGSQGARRVNTFIMENLKGIIELAQVLHQTGVANLTEVERLSHAAVIDESFRNRYQAAGYLDENMGLALAAADIAIARAGASTIFELATFGVPSVLIPLAESANGHQRANAYAYAEGGAAAIIEEENLLPAIFMNQVKTLLSDDGRRSSMSAAAAKFATPDAANKLAVEILSLVA